MQPSWTLVLAPIRMGSVSPRSTAPYQTLDSSPRWTSPMTQAPGATQAERATRGKVSPWGSTLAHSFRSNAAPLPCTRCTCCQISTSPFGCPYAGAIREPPLQRRSYFHQHGVALAAAGADGRETFSASSAPQLVEERRQDACARRAYGMA